MKRFASILLALALLVGPVYYAPELRADGTNSSRPSAQIGGEVISNPSSSTALTVTAGTQWALISVRTAGIHISLDGTAATTNDLYIPSGAVIELDISVMKDGVKVINSSDGSATVYVAYMGGR